jgi:polar amino acid transport system substrate-binding protein
MKKRSAILLFVILFVFCVSSVATAGATINKILKNKVLVVGTTADYPPFTAKTKDGKVMGLDMDLAGAIAVSMGVQLKVEKMPFDQLIPALEAGKIDMIISCMTMGTDRNLRIAFVGPYFISGQALLTSKESALSLNTPADINNADFSLAVEKGTTSEQIAKTLAPKAKLTVANDMDSALNLLYKKKVKAVMADYPLTKVMAFRNQDKGLIATERFSFEPIGIGIDSKDPLFMNMLTNLIGRFQGNGLLTTIIKRWFEDPSWIKLLP